MVISYKLTLLFSRSDQSEKPEEKAGILEDDDEFSQLHDEAR